MTHDLRDALKPCPFCGSKSVAQGATGKQTISVWCMGCGARGPDVPFPDFCDSVAQISLCHQRWNTRALTASPGEQKPWRFEIKYGPEGEANYAWVYDHNNEMVCTAKTYHAKQIVERVTSPPTAAGLWNDTTMPKRPFAFAVQRPPENGQDKWRLFMDEGAARAEAEQLDGDYEALYRIGDRRSAIEALRREAPAPEGVADLWPRDLEKYIPDIVKNAMLTMWNDICADTNCHPLDLEHGQGRRLTFTPRHWAEASGKMVQQNIHDLFASRPDAGSGVRLPHGYALVPTKPTPAMIEAGCEQNPTQWNEGTDLGFAADVANDVYVAMVSAATLSTSPVAAESNASAEARLREALMDVCSLFDDEGNLREEHQDHASTALEKAERAVALSTVGVKSEGSPANPDQGLASQHEYPDESRSGRNSSRNQSASSDPTAERREIVARHVEPLRKALAFQDSREPQYRAPETETARPLLPSEWPSIADARAILAALDGGR